MVRLHSRLGLVALSPFLASSLRWSLFLKKPGRSKTSFLKMRYKHIDIFNQLGPGHLPLQAARSLSLMIIRSIIQTLMDLFLSKTLLKNCKNLKMKFSSSKVSRLQKLKNKFLKLKKYFKAPHQISRYSRSSFNNSNNSNKNKPNKNVKSAKSWDKIFSLRNWNSKFQGISVFSTSSCISTLCSGWFKNGYLSHCSKASNPNSGLQSLVTIYFSWH